MLFPARWPNFDSSMYSTKNWKKLFTTKDSTYFADSTLKNINLSGALVYAIAGKKWVVNVEQVEKGNSIAMKMRNHWFNSKNGWYTGKGEGYVLKHLAVLDTLDEWHWQKDTLYLMSAEKPQNITAQTEEIILEGSNVNNVIIRNISFFSGQLKLKNAEHVIFDNVDFKYGTAPKIYDYSNGASYANIQFTGDCEGCEVINSRVDGNWGGGIYTEGKGTLITNCKITNSNWIGNGTSAIALVGKDHVVSFCDLSYSGKFLIVHNAASHVTIKNNHLHHAGYLANDLGLTYCYDTDGDNSEIAYNVVHDNEAKEAGVGIYIDMEGKKFLIHHNVVWNCTNGIQTVMNAYDHEIYNNTIWNCGKAINYWGVDGSNMYNQKVYNNLANDIFDAGTDIQNNLSTGVDYFVDLKNHDFRLKQNSPALDYGVYIPGINEDIVGEKPDAGAFEWGAPLWKYGYDSTLIQNN